MINDSNYNAVARVIFYKNGTIKEITFSDNTNEIYREELKELIEGIIPKNVTDNIYNEDDNKFSVSNISNNYVFFDDDALVDSNYDSKVTTKVENQTVKDFSLKKEFFLKNSDYNRTNNKIKVDPDNKAPPENLNDVDLETLNILIQSFDVTVNINSSFDKNVDDDKAKEYADKLKNIKFSKDTSSGRLRFLSKEEYEKNIKLQNAALKGLKNIRNLQDSEIEYTSSMEQAFAFNYEIFKTNMLGVQIAIIASINWTPKSGFIEIGLNYVRGRNISEIEKKNITINNFKEVTKSYKAILNTIIAYLQKEVIKYIEGYNINISEDHFNKYIDNFNKAIGPLSSLFVDYLQTDLEKFKKDVMTYVKYCYNNLFDDMQNNLLALLTTIEDQIKAGKQKEINDLVNESQTTVLNLINKQNVNLIDLIEKANIFIDNSQESIRELKSYQFVPIDYYYRVIEIFKRIDVLIQTYESTLKSSIDAEFLQLQTYVNDNIYLGEMDAYIDQVEIVWDIFHYNEILNQTVTLDHATEFVEKLGNVRNRYLAIKNNLLDAVKQTYNKLINKELKESVLNVETLKLDLTTKETAFIELMKPKVKYITNYNIYNEDIQKIIQVENKISELRINGYEQYIFNKINAISSDIFLSSENLNSLKSTIKNEVNSLLNNLKNNGQYKDNYDNILSKFENLLSNDKIKEYINAIKNKVGSNDVLTYINDYYTYIINTGLSQYKEVTDKIINNNLENYVNTPDELITKIKHMRNISLVNSNVNELNEKISSLINDKMTNLFNEIVSKIINFVTTQVNYIRDTIPNNYLITNKKIIETGDFYYKSNQLIETLNNKVSEYLSNLKSNVNLRSNIEEQEKIFVSNITNFADEIKKKFDTIFCVKTDCKSLIYQSMDATDKYYFQVSKFRDALNHLTLLQPYIDDVVNDNLKGLSSIDFLNLYKNPSNFDVNTVNGKIKELLYNLNKQGMEITQKNVDLLKKQIKESFSSSYANLSEDVFPKFFRTLFNKNDYLEEELNVLLIEISKKIRNGTTMDVMILNAQPFFFNGSRDNIEVEFNQTILEILNKLVEEEEKIKNSLDLSVDFKNKVTQKLKKKLEEDFEIYYKELKNMFSALATKNCILLDNDRKLVDILDEAKKEIKKDLESDYNINIKNLLDGLLKSFRDEIIDEYFDYFNNNFKGKYRFYFDSIRNHLLQYSDPKSDNIIKSIPNNTILGFNEGLNFALSELKNLIDLDKIIKKNTNDTVIDNLLKSLLNKLSFKINDNIKKNLEINIDDLKTVCDIELISEKDSFKESLLDYIEVGFNLTVKNFINGPGVSYLDGIFTDDYKNKIVPKLDYILSQCKEIDEYLKLILEGLFDVDSYLSDSVDEVYYQLMNYINDGISQDKVSAKILKKLLDFKYDSAKKIVEYFKEYTLGILSNDSFKNSLSLQVRKLIPTYIPLTITLNFTNFYYEILDSAYLKNIHNIYSTTIDDKRENIIKEVEKLRQQRTLQVDKLAQRSSSTHIAIDKVEYHKLNASLSQIKNDFSFNLSQTKKDNASNLLANSQLKLFLENILKLYYEDFEFVQNNIKSNVFLQVDIKSLEQKIKDLFKSLSNGINETVIISDRDEFMQNFTLKFKDLEKWVYQNYKEQHNYDTSLKSIENRRRLDVDIKIENIQNYIDVIDYKIKNLTLNIFNSEKLIELQDKINAINSQINIQLILLENKLDSYIKYVSFYLTKNNLEPYESNKTTIYKKVEEILNDYLKNQSDIFNKILEILGNYSDKFNDDVKPELIKAINNVVKFSSKQLITKYLNNSESNNETVVLDFLKKTDLTNLGGLSTVLGSTRLNFSTNIQKITFNWGHKFKIDPSNYKVYLDIIAGGYADGYIIYHNDYYNTSVGGAFANGNIGINFTNDYLNEIVYATYFTDMKTSSLQKYLFELTKLDSWDVCEDAVDCFVGKNDDYCPYNVIVEDDQYNIYKPEKYDSDYYKNKSIYVFNGYYENNLCTFANYFYSAEEKRYEFSSELNMTV